MGSPTNNGANNWVNAIAINGTNNIFVGGSFTSVAGGSTTAHYVASWNGNSWNTLGTGSANNGVDNSVYALAMNGTNQLFVGGQFTSALGRSLLANYIASWNGNSWSFLGTSSSNKWFVPFIARE